MFLSLLKSEQVGRYKDIAWVLFKHGGRELADRFGFGEVVDDEWTDGDQKANAEELADDLEKLGPTFVKFGQVLSSRADLLPMTYLKALSRLQDEVEPFAYDEVERIMVEEFGATPSELYATFDVKPMAAASLGQAHRATLADGQRVVVKVLRPGIRERVQADLDALHQIARWIDEHSEFGRRYHFLATIRQFRRSLMRELDYTREADNLRTLSRNLESFERIVVPAPIDELCSDRVLTMQHMDGSKITDITPEQRTHVDGMKLIDELFHAYLKQVLLDGFFHADPHPGNVLLTREGRVAIIDLGMVGHLDESLQENLLNLLMAISEGRSDDAADLAMSVGDSSEVFDPKAFRAGMREVLSEHREQSVGEMETGHLLMDVCRVAGGTGLRIPAPILLLGKALMNLDQIGRTLAPDFDPNEALRRHTVSIVRTRTMRGLRPGQLFTNLMEMKHFTAGLPRRVDRLLDTLADNDLRFKIDAIDEDQLIAGIQKIANRVTAGLVLAALIVGAAMMMSVETDFTIFGYPGLAVLCFFGAAIGGVILLIDVLWMDTGRNKRGRR
ncbi:ABC1 kinase family protein [Phycisphaerales bacterium AB-hyl4]|uniref:ABC1 kinase family protein n=1 Tax=Natronomicrosphaera hydrolytica TaxID=3242702 RepID=A0ABV4U2I5_9BACT